MEVVQGTAFVVVNGEEEKTFGPGESWEVQAGGHFTIRAESPVHYVCHFEWDVSEGIK